MDYCIDGGLLRHAAAHSSACRQKNSRSGILPARESISSLTLYCSSASRNLENTVDYCIHGGLLRHAAAHSSTCKQNKSRSGIIAARESISSLTLYCSSASTNLEHTVDYCIHGGLLRHAAAHSSACKQKNSRSGINFFTDMLPHPCQCSTRT